MPTRQAYYKESQRCKHLLQPGPKGGKTVGKWMGFILGLMVTLPSMALGVSPEPPGVHARLFEKLDKDVRACEANANVPKCVFTAVWATADKTADGDLGTAEINRFFRIIAGGVARDEYLKALNAMAGKKGSEARKTAEMEYVISVGLIGAMVTPALIANLDYDSSGTLSQDEILGDTDFISLMSEVKEQQKSLPNRLLEAFMNLKGLMEEP